MKAARPSKRARLKVLCALGARITRYYSLHLHFLALMSFVLIIAKSEIAEDIFRVTEVTLKMASAQVVETSVTDNSPSQDSNHPDDLFQSRCFYPKLNVAMFSRKNLL